MEKWPGYLSLYGKSAHSDVHLCGKIDPTIKICMESLAIEICMDRVDVAFSTCIEREYLAL